MQIHLFSLLLGITLPTHFQPGYTITVLILLLTKTSQLTQLLKETKILSLPKYLVTRPSLTFSKSSYIYILSSGYHYSSPDLISAVFPSYNPLYCTSIPLNTVWPICSFSPVPHRPSVVVLGSGGRKIMELRLSLALTILLLCLPHGITGMRHYHTSRFYQIVLCMFTPACPSCL